MTANLTESLDRQNTLKEKVMFPISTGISPISLTKSGVGKVLIVDNDEHVLVALERTLEEEGYVTATAINFEQAWQLLSQRCFDVLVLDDYLSDRDSIEVLMELRRTGIRPATIVVTYHRQPSRADRARLRLLGAGGFINKCAHSELATMIRRLFARHPRPLGYATG